MHHDNHIAQIHDGPGGTQYRPQNFQPSHELLLVAHFVLSTQKGDHQHRTTLTASEHLRILLL